MGLLLAQTNREIEKVFGKIDAPAPLQPLVAQGGAGGLSVFLSNIVSLIYTVAAVVFLFMIIFSAFQWIISGGDKEAVSKARSRLTYAVIGVVLLALAFVFMNLLSQLTHFRFFSN